MQRSDLRWRIGAAVTGVSVLIATCGGSVASPSAPTSAAPPSQTESPPSPAPTATPTAAPTPTASPVPSASAVAPTATPNADPVAVIQIAKPYTLAADPTNSMINGSVDMSLGGLTVHEVLSGRKVYNAAAFAGYLVGIMVNGVPMTDAVYKGAVNGAVLTSKAAHTTATIGSTKVDILTIPNSGVVMFRRRGMIVMVIASSVSSAKAITAAVLKATP
jgi:hypothetical protein